MKLSKYTNNKGFTTGEIIISIMIIILFTSLIATAYYNYYISKEANNNKTVTRIKLLTEEETIKEIARIASGEITDVALKHAMELRKSAT